ncbi:DMP19 family protein [Pendulispora rubella]|uniref:DMP19 family protein n=2 Tax=Pendulispora rubella TaxID=2741070 RepID=A0ABZ2LIQ7_9BACT
MWQSVEIHGDYDDLRAGLILATPGQVAVFAVRWCDHEVCNGGFHQLFYNSTGILFPEAVQGLQQIGATDYASFFSQAASLLPSADVPRDRDERIRLLERVPYELWKKQIKPVEDAYYALRRTGTTVERHAARYVEEHSEDFFDVEVLN